MKASANIFRAYTRSYAFKHSDIKLLKINMIGVYFAKTSTRIRVRWRAKLKPLTIGFPL